MTNPIDRPSTTNDQLDPNTATKAPGKLKTNWFAYVSAANCGLKARSGSYRRCDW